MRVSARSRLEQFLDPGKHREIAANLESIDVLRFKDHKKYRDRLSAAQKKTGEKDALVVMAGKLKGANVIACAFEFGFMGGSMGSVVGEKFTRAAQECLRMKAPLVCFSASGGARMQEGLLSLMQMAKTSTMLARLSEEGLPFISVLTHPTTGGVSASLGMLGDLNIAEPLAQIGLPAPGLSNKPYVKNCQRAFSAVNFCFKKAR